MQILALLVSAAGVTAGLGTPPQARVSAAARAGNGCPVTHKVTAALSADLAELTVELPELKIEATTTRSFARTHCDAVVTIDHAPNWQVSPAAVELTYAGSIPSEDTGDITFKVYHQGTPINAQASAPLDGLAASAKTVTLPLSEAWSACAASSTVIEGLALKITGRSPGYLQVQKVGALKLKWRPCTSK